MVFDLSEAKYLTVDFLSVGQGDSIFIKTRFNQRILIDGGPDNILVKLGERIPFYDKTIDLMILSHPERDHISGLFEVLKRYEVKNIVWSGVIRDTKEWEEWVNLIKEEGANIKIASSSLKIVLGKETIDVLNPLVSLEGKEFENSNSTSLVLLLTNNNASFLFSGDIDLKTEKQIDVDANVLKVSHHGSKYSTSESFLERVSPEVAIISVGENSYGHPSEEVLLRLQKFGIQTLITREVGDIKVATDGNNIKIVKK